MSPLTAQRDAPNESTEVKLSPQSSKIVSEEGTGSMSIPTQPSDHTPDGSVPNATTNPITPEKITKSRVLARSFRAIGSMLGLSLISKSFKGKSILCSDDNLLNTDANNANCETEWAEVVDIVVESDDGSGPMDSYIEFMRNRNMKRHRGEPRGMKSIWDAKTKLEKQKENDNVDDGEHDPDGSDNETAESETSIPWFSSNS